MMEAEKEYAVALFSVAAEEGNEKEVFSDLLLIRDLIGESPEYVSLLSSPALSAEEKSTLLDEAFASMTESVRSFLGLLCQNGRMPLIPQIIEEYGKLHRASEKEICATVSSAVELNSEQKQSVIEKLEAKLGKKVIASFETDPTLIGGIKVYADGVTFDNSVKKRLSEMKDVMLG